MKNKLFITSVVLVITGVTFLFLEGTFYGNVDKKGFLQESLFLPLGAIFSVIGGLGIIVSVVRNILMQPK